MPFPLNNFDACDKNLLRYASFIPYIGSCNCEDLRPVFKSTTSQFQTIIFASSDTPNVGDHDGDMSETKLTERQQRILNLIKESPTITGKQMSETLSVSQRTIEHDLSTMQKKGVLKHEGKDNDGKWIIIAKN